MWGEGAFCWDVQIIQAKLHMWGRKGTLEPDNCPNLLFDFGYFYTECTVFRVSHILPDVSPPFGSALHVKRQCPVTRARASAIVCSPFLCHPSQREFSRFKNNSLCCQRGLSPWWGENWDSVPFRAAFWVMSGGGGRLNDSVVPARPLAFKHL